jgi:AmmeMemoRadiSam system protein A
MKDEWQELLGEMALDLAERAVRGALGLGVECGEGSREVPELPGDVGGLFVTLRARGGGLIGCMGLLERPSPWPEVVADLAVRAALHDPRTPRASATDLEGAQLEISFLRGFEQVECGDERGLMELIGRERPGVLLESEGRRATFLPGVWEQLAAPAEFWAQLKRKAGLGPLPLGGGSEVWIYRSRSYVRPMR